METKPENTKLFTYLFDKEVITSFKKEKGVVNPDLQLSFNRRKKETQKGKT